MSGGRWWPFQEFMIRGRDAGPVQDVDLRGAAAAVATPQVLDALRSARAIVIGPSNPIVSIEPILRVPGIRQALGESSAAVVAVSPLVRGEVLKGPTAQFMQWAGYARNSDGLAAVYDGVIDGLVADARTDLLPVLEADVLLDTPQRRRAVAAATLDFALSLAPRD
jgi:LPPG:FO 2-phospho-L-lactate transferase